VEHILRKNPVWLFAKKPAAKNNNAIASTVSNTG
jgi:hypothetical protein